MEQLIGPLIWNMPIISIAVLALAAIIAPQIKEQ